MKRLTNSYLSKYLLVRRGSIFLHAELWNKPSQYLISLDQISIWWLLGEYDRYFPHSSVTADIDIQNSASQACVKYVFFLKSTPQDNDESWERDDFVFQWWAFSLSTGGPLCSILHHSEASVQVANLSARLSWFTMEWQRRPHYQGRFRIVLTRQNVFFQIHLEQHKGNSALNAAISLLLPKDK